MTSEHSIKVSIAICTLNHEKHLSKSLDSVLAQKHNFPFEIVISDGGSCDSTPKIIQQYAAQYPEIIRPISSSDPIIPAKNYLHALRACQGEYIATLEGNDYWTDPQKLHHQISFLDANPTYTLSCHRFHIYYENIDKQSNDFFQNELFKSNPEGFEFGQDQFFKHWFTQNLTVVFRNQALKNTEYLNTHQYCWDSQVLWTVLGKGKGYLHNFFGGVCQVYQRKNWSQEDEIKQSTLYYLLIEELIKRDPSNNILSKRLAAHQRILKDYYVNKKNLLDYRLIKNRNFTIISDGRWGEELYKAFNLQPNSPFIGTQVFHHDYLELLSNLNFYLSQPLEFIGIVDSKHISNHDIQSKKNYPIARLGKKVEIHFTNYASIEDAKDTWNKQVEKINWNNLFTTIDLTQQEEVTEILSRFCELVPNPLTRACFLSEFRKRELANHPLKEQVTLISNWNTDHEICFRSSLFNLDVVNWLNHQLQNAPPIDPSEIEILDSDERMRAHTSIRFDDHFFLQFSSQSIAAFVCSFYFPMAYQISFHDESDSIVIKYNKNDIENLYLSLQPTTDEPYVDSYIDLTNSEHRNIFVLTKGNTQHTLKIDLIGRNEVDDYNGTSLSIGGLEEKLPAKFEWVHFDFTESSSEYLEQYISQIKALSITVNPQKKATGKIEIIAIFIGSVAKFNEILSQH